MLRPSRQALQHPIRYSLLLLLQDCYTMSASNLALGLPQHPRSVDQVTKAAQDYDFDASVPLKYWLRTASALSKQVGSIKS